MAPLVVPDAELAALVAGATVVAFVARGTLSEGDEVELVPEGAVSAQPPGEWSAVVAAVDAAATAVDAAALDRPAAGRGGDLVVLRVYGVDGPVLDDTAFEAARQAVEGAMRR
jgi:hypothetical protein